jgi:serine/threonine protein kinase
MKHCPQCSTGYPDTLAACPTHSLPLNEIRDLKPGMVVHHSYRIVRKLGQGGMGAVYLAQHTLMDEPRALKFLSAELSQDAAFTARFLREVRTLRQIRHQNVVDCGDLESAEDGSLFFSMEFVDGPDLRAFLLDSSYRDSSDSIDCHPERSSSRTLRTAESKDPRLHSADESSRFVSGHDFSRAETPKNSNGVLTPAGALPVPLALALTRQIAAGLAAAHARGMVHRDIKPENILLARDPSGWQPKIADFGIVATKESSSVFTRTGGTLLTVAYAAPEQWRGTPAAQLDGRTDLYALGGLLYEMLTGRSPFHAESYEGWAQAHQTTPPPPPSALRPDLANWQGLDAFVQRLLAKDREDRPKNVAELLTLLDAIRYLPPEARRETVREDTAMDATQASAENSPDPAILSRSWWAAAVVSMLLVALLVFGLSRSKTLNEPTGRPQLDPRTGEPFQSAVRPLFDPFTGETIQVQNAAAPDKWEQYVIAWTDPATGLMWAKNDNGSDVNWNEATNYCQKLKLDDHSDWRLPTIDELKGIYDANANVNGYHVKGDLHISSWWYWSSSLGNTSESAWGFTFSPGMRESFRLGDSLDARALCVRWVSGTSPKFDPNVPNTATISALKAGTTLTVYNDDGTENDKPWEIDWSSYGPIPKSATQICPGEDFVNSKLVKDDNCQPIPKGATGRAKNIHGVWFYVKMIPPA